MYVEIVAMNHFGDTIKRLMKEKGLTVRSLAAKSKVDKNTIQRATKVENPIAGDEGINQGTLLALSRGLGIDWEELRMEWQGPRIREKSNGGPGIPVINQAPAGNVIPFEECSIVDSGTGYKYITRGFTSNPDAFAVIVTGDSMEPKLHEGDYAIFVPMTTDGVILGPTKRQVKDGHTVYVRFVNGKRDGCTIGRVFRLSDGRIEISKLNPKYDAIVAEPEELILFALTEIRRPEFPGDIEEHDGYQDER